MPAPSIPVSIRAESTSPTRLVGERGNEIHPAAFWRAVTDRVRETPAVDSASLARVPPGGVEGIGLGGVAPGDKRARRR